MQITISFSRFARIAPFIGFHHVLLVVIALAIILLSLLLAGCSSSSPQIPSIFLITMFYERYNPVFNLAQVDPHLVTAMANIVGGAETEVRVGFFGICIRPDHGSYICNSNATALAEIVTVDQDPLNLIWVASTFKEAVVFPYLLVVSIILAFFCFIILATFPGWHEGIDLDGTQAYKPVPSRPVSQVALALIFISSVFVLVSVLWQHTASVAASTIAQDMGNGSVKSGIGTSAMVLGWFAFGLLVLASVGLLVMVLSFRIITEQTDLE